MPSDAAMKVWREAHQALYWLPKGAQGEQAAAAVIDRAIADAVEQERAKAEALAEALRGNGAWLESWGQHVGTCAGGNMCSCGLTFARYENTAALKAWEATPPG